MGRTFEYDALCIVQVDSEAKQITEIKVIVDTTGEGWINQITDGGTEDLGCFGDGEETEEKRVAKEVLTEAVNKALEFGDTFPAVLDRQG